MPASPGQTLSHYRLIEKIGEGGMGVVWKAEDTVLGRTVAIKVLPADVARDEKRRQMFLGEARLASSLSEAHIAQVYEFGREADEDFLVMEYVEGKPLSKILHGRLLPPEKVANIGLQTAQALARAHRKNLLHRDLKPSNIMVTRDGDVKVVDFGLATLFAPMEMSATGATTRSLPVDAPTARDASGEHGPAGTLPYMSPEQVRGERLDSRSDVFSLGVVLYEATSGQRPFMASSPSRLAQEIVRGRSRPVHELVPSVPLELDRIIQKALASKPTERYQTMDDLAVDLKRLSREIESGSSPSYASLFRAPRRALRWWVAAGGILFFVTVVAVGWMLGPWRRDPAVARTVLILPMEVRGQTEGGDYVGRAFAEALAMNLAQSKNLNVLAVPEKGEVKTARSFELAETAAGLGAGRLVRGSLTRSGSAVLVNLSLIDTAQNRILWGSQKSDPDGSLSALAASLVRDLLAHLEGTPQARYDHPLNITGSPPMAASAEMAEVQGALRRVETKTALDSTQRLIRKFPQEPDAYALRAYAVFRGVIGKLATRDQLEQSLRDLERIDPRHSVAQNIRCETLGWDNKREEGFKCAAGLVARDDLTPAARGWALRNLAGQKSARGDTQGALADIKEAASLDPTNHFNFKVLGGIQLKMGDPDAAIVSFRQSIALTPGDEGAQALLAYALGVKGEWREAAVLLGLVCNKGNDSEFCSWHAYALLMTGDRTGALAAARKAAALVDDPKQNVDDAVYVLARFWALAGDKAQALRFLRRAVKLERADVKTILAEPDLKPLHGDPEFQAILAAAAKRSQKE